MAGKPKHIKVCLTNRGDDAETPWAEDLGAVPGGRKVRLINVPFMHAKPTWGDVIVVAPVEDGFPTWDRDGVPWAEINSRIDTDSGRWAMILDYAPHPDARDIFDALVRACAEHDIVCEGAWGPRAGEPGRAYLAVSGELTDVDVMRALRGAELPCELLQIHPEPTVRPSKERAAAKAAAKAAPKAAPKAVPVAKPAAKKPAAKRPAKPEKKRAAKKQKR